MSKWRYRCPEGHTSLRTRITKPGYWCTTCQRPYEGEPVDMKQEAMADA